MWRSRQRSRSRATTRRRRIRDTLPQVGYGQGEVVASPLRMAAIAAAIAADGKHQGRASSSHRRRAAAAHPFLSSRDRAHPWRLHARRRARRHGAQPQIAWRFAIAGKTGTAEVTGAPSHSWFVGFAPYGTASHRVAVAVILENAGYGGAGAAPAAGEIIAAAVAGTGALGCSARSAALSELAS